MALSTCKECKKDVSTLAEKCPHCGVGRPTANPGMNINMGWKGWLICSILGLILIAQMMPKVPDSPKVRACFAAEGFVRNRLVSPSTASFTNCYDPAANVSATAFGFSIYGTVDSQNSFGAMIRSKYHVELNNDGEDYRLVSISID